MQQTLKFHEVVWQDILGVVGNVIYSFVGNLTDFPAVKEFENRLRFDEIFVKVGGTLFLDRVYNKCVNMMQLLKGC